MALSTPSVLAGSTGTCKEYEPECIGPTQKGLLYAGLALIAVGVAGNIVSVKPFLLEQTTDDSVSGGGAAPADPKAGIPLTGGGKQVLGLIIVVIVGIVGAVALPYIKPWTLRFGIPAICTAVGTLLYLSGAFTCSYKQAAVTGSPLTNVCRVFVAAALKSSQSYPADNQLRYHTIATDQHKRFTPTSCLRRLHKACIILPGEATDAESRNKWRLCSVAQVEEAKIAVRMVPMWMTFIVCGIVCSIGDTYFVEQAGKLNRNIGKLRLPIQVLLLARRSTKDYVDSKVEAFLKWMQRDNAPSFGIAGGMICSVLCCISAALVEKRRLKVVVRQGLLDDSDGDIDMSIYWLLFQFVLLGGLESFLECSMNAYYKTQAPDSMESYMGYFTLGVTGLGFMFSSVSVYVVGKISEKGGRRNWFQETLNQSRLDRYFWVLAALSSVNLVVFGLVASRYRYKTPELGEKEDPDAVGDYTEGYVEEEERPSSCFC